MGPNSFRYVSFKNDSFRADTAQNEAVLSGWVISRKLKILITSLKFYFYDLLNGIGKSKFGGGHFFRSLVLVGKAS